MTLGALIDDLARTHGDRVALIAAQRRLTFAQLATESDAAAGALAHLGVSAGTRVGVLMPNRPEFLTTAIGAWKLGAIVVPINTLFRLPELEYALHHADVTILIAAAQFLRHDYAAMLSELCPELTHAGDRSLHSWRVPCLRRVILCGEPRPAGALDFDAWIASAGEPDRDWLAAAGRQVTEGDDAAIFFTSGSTAAPKGVVHSHATMVQAARNVADRLGTTADDRTWAYLPFFFNGGMVGVALATLAQGATLLLQEVFEPGETLRLMRDEECTLLFAWPHQAQALIAHPDFDRNALRIRKGPGANTPWAAQLFQPDHQAVGTWGMTETGPMACSSRFDDPLALRAGAHGRAMPGLDVRIVDPVVEPVIDPDLGAPLPTDAEGEIVVRGSSVRGSSVMDRYYKIRPVDCFDAQGFFHTGDLGRLDASGHLHFIGRIKDVIKTAGVNVAAAEVEAVLTAHPDVRLACVTAVPHPARGENVAAFVVVRSTALGAEALLDFCRARLATYKVPRHLFFCSEADLPVLGSGKIDRQRLRALAAKRALAESSPE
ncbi:MAG: AMP-binding protein [Deltaproteobacteria bacterium]|nr:AMP-binding protein [Deltaproteobacteria bacterium]